MRCNLLHPWFLTDQHLMAERRELRMIPPLLKKRVASNIPLMQGIPERYCLGVGHMLFWLDKMGYLAHRFDCLTQEMFRRGFNPNEELTFDLETAKVVGVDKDWEPLPDDYDVIVTRLRERIEKRFTWYKFCGIPITRKWFEATYPIPYFQ